MSRRLEYDFRGFSRLKPHRIVVLTGMGRTGKTSLGRLLGSLETVEFTDEPWMLELLPPMEKVGLVGRSVAVKLLRALWEEYFSEVYLLRMGLRRSDYSSAWNFKSPREIARRLAAPGSRSGLAKVLARKRISFAMTLTQTPASADLFMEAFPRALVVHVVRHPFPTARFVAERGWHSDDTMRRALNNELYYRFSSRRGVFWLPWWVRPDDSGYFMSLRDEARGLYCWNRMIEATLAASGRPGQRLVRSEAMHNDPESVLAPLARELGARRGALTGRLIKRMRRAGKSKPDLTPVDAPSELLSETRRLASKLGYTD